MADDARRLAARLTAVTSEEGAGNGDGRWEASGGGLVGVGMLEGLGVEWGLDVARLRGRGFIFSNLEGFLPKAEEIIAWWLFYSEI